MLVLLSFPRHPSCEPCGFDCHPGCFDDAAARPKPVLDVEYGTAQHKHPLTFQATVYRGAYICNICSKHGEGEVYQSVDE